MVKRIYLCKQYLSHFFCPRHFTMADLHFFNPGNDLALASGQRYYTPPSAAVAMEHAGTWLPLLLGKEGDYILAGNHQEMPGDTRSWDHGMKAWHGEDISALRPWGWSLWAMESYARAFRKINAAWSSSFEDCADIRRVSALSHRRTSVELHNALRSGLAPVEAFCRTDIEYALDRWERVVGKSPLSGSGRGVFHGSRQSADAFIRRCDTAIARQGSVMIERELDSIAEFAMLFAMSRISGVRFIGYSLFETSGDTYMHNTLLPDDEIRRHLQNICRSTDFRVLEKEVTEAMRRIVGPVPYDGCFGIDMMIFDNGGVPAVNPCIEVNMRTTMGVVAWNATRRLLHPESSGHFGVSSRSETHPHATWLDGRLSEGRVTLSPPDSDITFFIEAIRN